VLSGMSERERERERVTIGPLVDDSSNVDDEPARATFAKAPIAAAVLLQLLQVQPRKNKLYVGVVGCFLQSRALRHLSVLALLPDDARWGSLVDHVSERRERRSRSDTVKHRNLRLPFGERTYFLEIPSSRVWRCSADITEEEEEEEEVNETERR
jgi:hypothetical protein